MRATLVLAMLLLSHNVWAQRSSVKGQAEYDAAITSAGFFGAPRATTALLPACGASNTGAVRFDTTLGLLKVCTGSAWVAPLTSPATFAQGGTGLTTAADDTTLVSSGSAWVATAIQDCQDVAGNHLNYTVATNAYSCGTSAASTGANTALSNLASVAVNSPLGLGGTATTFPSVEWNTVQTPDTGMLLTGSTSNNWVVAERADAAFDFAAIANTDPTLKIFSHNQSTNQWVSLAHNGTSATLSTGLGGLLINGIAGTGDGLPTISLNNTFLYFTDIAGVATRVFLGKSGNPAFGGTLAGGVANGASNSVGGTINLAGGRSAGAAAPARVHLQAGALPGTAASGTLHTIIDRHIVGASKYLTNNTVTTVTNVTVAANTVAAGSVQYACEVFDATDLQVEEGEVAWHVSNKAGTIANNVTLKYGNQQLATAGTLAVTWTITAANPALLQVNCNSSLTPAAGYPRVTYSLVNLTQQGVAIQ